MTERDMLQATTQDDAGRRVPLVRFNLTLFPISFGPLPPAVQQEIRGEMMVTAWKWENWLSVQAWVRGAWVGLIPPAILWGGFHLVRFLFPHGLALLFLVPLVLTPVAIAAMLFLSPMSMSDLLRRRAAHIAAANGHCGSCGYPLAHLSAADMARITCSECGAEWESRDGLS